MHPQKQRVPLFSPNTYHYLRLVGLLFQADFKESPTATCFFVPLPPELNFLFWGHVACHLYMYSEIPWIFRVELGNCLSCKKVKGENTISTLPIVAGFSAWSTSVCKVTEFPWLTTAASPFSFQKAAEFAWCCWRRRIVEFHPFCTRKCFNIVRSAYKRKWSANGCVGWSYAII